MSETNEPERQPKRSATSWAWRILAHGLAVAVIAVLSMVPFVNEFTLEVMWASAEHTEYLALTWFEVALHIGLAGCLWALMVLLFDVVRSKRQPVRKVLKLRQGSVMTETLIILPVFLLLTFGIAQLAVNNMAGIVANAAVFQSGRTAWLWASEAQVGRSGVTMTKAREMARVQAAAVLTPVAPGDFIQSPFGGSEEFKDMRGILLGSQIPYPSSDLGAVGQSAVPIFFMFDSVDPRALTSLGGNMTGMTSIPGKNSSFYRAFDASGFRSRTVRKFTFAYGATSVDLVDRGDEYGAHINYLHMQAFPVVDRIFGDFTIVESRPGYYMTIEREFTMPKQVVPNPRRPR